MVDITEKLNYLNASLQAGLLSRCRKESGVFGGVGVGFSITLEVGFFLSDCGSPIESLHRTLELGIRTRAY